MTFQIIEVDQTKMEVTTKWSRLSNSNEVCSFLRLADYDRRFIEDFSIRPMIQLVRRALNFSGQRNVNGASKS